MIMERPDLQYSAKDWASAFRTPQRCSLHMWSSIGPLSNCVVRYIMHLFAPFGSRRSDCSRQQMLPDALVVTRPGICVPEFFRARVRPSSGRDM